MHPFDIHYTQNRTPNNAPTNSGNPVPAVQDHRRPSVQLLDIDQPTSHTNRRPSAAHFQQPRRPSAAQLEEPSASRAELNIPESVGISVQPYNSASYLSALDSSTSSRPSLPPMNEAHRERRSYEFLRNMVNYFNPHNHHSNNRQRSPHHHQEHQYHHSRHDHQRQRDQSDQQSRRLVSQTSEDTPYKAPSEKSRTCPKCLLIAFLIICSLIALGISGFLLYEYLHQETCSKEPLETLSKNIVLRRDDVSHWGHIRVEKDGSEKYLRKADDSRTNSVVGSNGITSFYYGLELNEDGTYYIYFSISVAHQFVKNSSPKDFSALLTYKDANGSHDRLLRSEHTWCRDCGLDQTTLYNGGVFELRSGGCIFVEVSSPNDVSEYSFLGMFRV